MSDLTDADRLNYDKKIDRQNLIIHELKRKIYNRGGGSARGGKLFGGERSRGSGGGSHYTDYSSSSTGSRFSSSEYPESNASVSVLPVPPVPPGFEARDLSSAQALALYSIPLPQLCTKQDLENCQMKMKEYVDSVFLQFSEQLRARNTIVDVVLERHAEQIFQIQTKIQNRDESSAEDKLLLKALEKTIGEQKEELKKLKEQVNNSIVRLAQLEDRKLAVRIRRRQDEKKEVQIVESLEAEFDRLATRMREKQIDQEKLNES